MDRKTLRNLFEGEIYPSEQINLRSKTGVKITKNFEKEFIHFQELLSKEEKERFNDFRTVIMDYMSEYGFESFAYGVKLGLNLSADLSKTK